MLDILSPLRGYIAQNLQFYLSKYIEDIQLEGLGLFGGDLVLNDLEIKRHVLRESLDIPSSFDFSRGFIRELRIHIPWTQLLSQPIEVKLYTIELILTGKSDDKRRSSRTASSEDPPKPTDASTSRASEEKMEQPKSGWLHDTLQKILANISVQVNNLVLKYEHDDVVFSIALGTLDFYSAKESNGWERSFEELDGERRAICKRIDAKDLTIFLDRYTSDGNFKNNLTQDAVRRKVVGYEMPVLSRTSASVRAKLLLFPNAAIKRQESQKSRSTSPLNRQLPTRNQTHNVEDSIIAVDGLFAYKPSVMCDPFYYYSCGRTSVVPLYEVDIFIGELLFSVSDRQLEMISQLVKSASSKLDQAHELSRQEMHVNDDLYDTAAVDSKAKVPVTTDVAALKKLSVGQNDDRDVAGSLNAHNTWFGWAINALSANEDEKEDELVSELLAETRGALLKAQGQDTNGEDDLLASNGPATKTFCVRLCISSASLTVRKHEKDEDDEEHPDSTMSDDEEFVPVANLGMVKVSVQSRKKRITRPAVPILLLSLSYVALEMLLEQGDEESGSDLVFEVEKVELVSVSASGNHGDPTSKQEQALLKWGSVNSSHFSDCVSHPYFISTFFGEETTRLNQREARSFEIVKVSLDADIPVWKTLEANSGRRGPTEGDQDTSCSCSTMWGGKLVPCIPVATVYNICEQAIKAIGIKERVLDEGILSNAVSTAWASRDLPMSISEGMSRALISIAEEYRAHRNPDLRALDNLEQLLHPQLVALFSRYTLHMCSATSLHKSLGSRDIRHRSVHSALRLRMASTSSVADQIDLTPEADTQPVSRILDISIGTVQAVLEPLKCVEIAEALSIILCVRGKHDWNTAVVEERSISPTELDHGPRCVVMTDVTLITVSSVNVCLPSRREQLEVDLESVGLYGDMSVIVSDVMWMKKFRPGSSRSQFQLGVTSVHLEAVHDCSKSPSFIPLLESLGVELLVTESSDHGGDIDGLFVNLDKLMINLNSCAIRDISMSLNELLSPLGWPITWDFPEPPLKTTTMFRIEVFAAAFSRLISNRPRLAMPERQEINFEIGSGSFTLTRATGNPDIRRVIFQGGITPFVTRGSEANTPLLKLELAEDKSSGSLCAVPLFGSLDMFSLNMSSLETTSVCCRFSISTQLAPVFVELSGVCQFVAVVLGVVKGVTDILSSGKEPRLPRVTDAKMITAARNPPTDWEIAIHLTIAGGRIRLNDALQLNIPLISVVSKDVEADQVNRVRSGGKLKVVCSLKDMALSAYDSGVLKEVAHPMVLRVEDFTASVDFSHRFVGHQYAYSADILIHSSCFEASLSRLKLLYLLRMPTFKGPQVSRDITTASPLRVKGERVNWLSLRDRWHWKLGAELDLVKVVCSADVKQHMCDRERPIHVLVSAEISNIGVAARIGNYHPTNCHLESQTRCFTDIQASVGSMRVVEKLQNRKHERSNTFGDFSALPEPAFLGVLVCLGLDDLKCLLRLLRVSDTSSQEQLSLPAAMLSWHLTNKIAKLFQAESRNSVAEERLLVAVIPLVASWSSPTQAMAGRSFPLLSMFYRDYNDLGLPHHLVAGSLDSVDIVLTTSSLYCLASVLKATGDWSAASEPFSSPSRNGSSSDAVTKDQGASDESPRSSLADLEVSILVGQFRLILPNECLAECIMSRQSTVNGNLCIVLESISMASALRNDIALDGLGYPPFNARVLPKRPTIQAHRFGQSQLRMGCRSGTIAAFIADLTFDRILYSPSSGPQAAGPFEERIGHENGNRAHFSNVETFWSPFNVACEIEEKAFATGKDGGAGKKVLGTIALSKLRIDLHKRALDALVARTVGVIRVLHSVGQSFTVRSTAGMKTKPQLGPTTRNHLHLQDLAFSCDGIEVNLFGADTSTHLRIGSVDIKHNFSSLAGSASVQNGAVGFRGKRRIQSLMQKLSSSEEVVFGAYADPSLWHLAVENYPEKLVAARWNSGEQSEGTLFLDVQAYQLHISHHFILEISRFFQSEPRYVYSNFCIDKPESEQFAEIAERCPLSFQPRWIIKVLVAPSVVSFWKRGRTDGCKASWIWITSGQVFMSVAIGGSEGQEQSLQVYGSTVSDINRFVVVLTLEMMLNVDKFGVNTADDLPPLEVHFRRNSIGSAPTDTVSTWQQFSKHLSTTSEGQRLLRDCSIRFTGDHHQILERVAVRSMGVCTLRTGVSRTNIQADLSEVCVKLSSCSLGALQSLFSVQGESKGGDYNALNDSGAHGMASGYKQKTNLQKSSSSDQSQTPNVSTDDFKDLRRMADVRRPSAGELVFTEALFIETQSVISSGSSSPMVATNLHIQIDPNDYAIDLAAMKAYIQDVNSPWNGGEGALTMEQPSVSDLSNTTHGWMEMRWCYHIPRRINRVVANPVPIPPTGVPGGWPSWSWNPDEEGDEDRLCDIFCQLRCWDQKKASYVLVYEFYVPWESASEGANELDDAYEPGSFGELVSQWFDDDMEETRYRRKLHEFSSYRRTYLIDETLASDNWELRWRSPLRREQETENNQKRLVVNALLATSLQVHSTLDLNSYQRVTVNVALPRVTSSISHVNSAKISHDIISAELNDTSIFCAVSGSEGARSLSIRLSSALQVYLDNMIQLLTVSVVPRTTVNAMIEFSSRGLEVSTLVGPASVYLNLTSMLVISSIPKLLQVHPKILELDNKLTIDDKLSSMRIKIVNCTGGNVWFRQEGTLECLQLEAGMSVPYSWLSLADSPYYQLRFALEDPWQKKYVGLNWQQQKEDPRWCDPCRIKDNVVTGRFFDGRGFLWICVELCGLQTIVTLRASLTFRNYCNFPVQVKLNGTNTQHCSARSNDHCRVDHKNNPRSHSNCISLDGLECSLMDSTDCSASPIMIESVSSIDVGMKGGPWCRVKMQGSIPGDFDLVKMSVPLSDSLKNVQCTFVELQSGNPVEPSRYAWVKFSRVQCQAVLPTDFDPMQPQISRRYAWMELSLWPAITVVNIMDIPVTLSFKQKAARMDVNVPPCSKRRLSAINPFGSVDVELQYGEDSGRIPTVTKCLAFSLNWSGLNDAQQQIFDLAGCRVVANVLVSHCPMVRIRTERNLSVTNLTPTGIHVRIGGSLNTQATYEKIDSCAKRSIGYSVVEDRLLISIGNGDTIVAENLVEWSPEILLDVKGDTKTIVVPLGQAGLTSPASAYSIELTNSDGYLNVAIRPQVVVINSTDCALKFLPTDGEGNALVEEHESSMLSNKNAGWCVPVCLHMEAKKRSITEDMSSWLSSRLSTRPSKDFLTPVKQTLVAKMSCSFRVCIAEVGYEWTEEVTVCLPEVSLQLNPNGKLSVDESQTSSMSQTNSHNGLYPTPSTTTHRRRLLIRHDEFRHKMLTYTITQCDNSINILFFVDHQPPVIIHNQWQNALGFRNVSCTSDPEGVGAGCYLEYDWSLQVSNRHTGTRHHIKWNDTETSNSGSDADSNKAMTRWLDAEVRIPESASVPGIATSTHTRFQIGSPQYGWSNALWQVGGIQFASFPSQKEDGAKNPTFLVRCFYRAGSWLISVSCLEDPTDDHHHSTLESSSMAAPTKTEKGAPSFLRIGVIVEELSLHFCDEHDPVRNARGLILHPEILRVACNAVSIVFATAPDPPEDARLSTRLGYLPHIRSYTTLYLAIEDIKVGHFLQMCNFPVILCFPEKHESSGLLEFDWVKRHEKLARVIDSLLDKQLPGASDTCLLSRVIYTDTWDPVGIPSYFHSVELRLAPAVLQVEDNILVYVNAFIRPVLDALEGETVLAADTNSGNVCRDSQLPQLDAWNLLAYQSAAVTMQRKVYIEYFEISNLQVTITARMSIPVLNSFDGTPLQFGSTQMHEVFSFPDQLYKDLAADYVADTIVRSPMLLMSLNILGNPAGFLRSFGQGVRDLVEIPLAASRSGYSPWVLTKGVMGGVASFLGHATTAALTSVSGFSYTISRTMDQLTLPSEQLRKRHYTRPTQLSSALADGLGSLGSSVVGAAAGVITTPIAVYRERQMQGLDTDIRNVVGGVGMGLVGIVARPMGGVASLVSMASDGLLYGSGMGSGRVPFDDVYQRFDARPNELLRYKLKVLPDVIGSTLVFAHGVWIVPDADHPLLTPGLEVHFLPPEHLKDQEDELVKSLFSPRDALHLATQVTVVCSSHFVYVVGARGAQNEEVLVRTPLQSIQAVEESLKEPTVFDLAVKIQASVEWLRFRLPTQQRRQLSHQLRLWLAEDAVV